MDDISNGIVIWNYLLEYAVSILSDTVFYELIWIFLDNLYGDYMV